MQFFQNIFRLFRQNGENHPVRLIHNLLIGGCDRDQIWILLLQVGGTFPPAGRENQGELSLTASAEAGSNSTSNNTNTNNADFHNLALPI